MYLSVGLVRSVAYLWGQHDHDTLVARPGSASWCCCWVYGWARSAPNKGILAHLKAMYFSPGTRIGEAAHPGPGLDAEADPFAELDAHLNELEEWDAERLSAWGAGPPDDDAVHLSAPRFIAARKFGGKKICMLFKLGESGLGYYKDVAPVLQLASVVLPSHSGPSSVSPLGARSRIVEASGPGPVGERPRRFRVRRRACLDIVQINASS